MTPTTRVPAPAALFPAAVGAGLTNRGKVREKNEDSILTDPAGMLWAVADGMGGYGHGDVASDIVIDCLAAIPHDAEPGAALVAQLEQANRMVALRQQEPGMGRMGSTVVAMMLTGALAHVVWVGRNWLLELVTLLIQSVDPPLVRTVTFCATDVVPTSWLPNGSAAGVTAMSGGRA